MRASGIFLLLLLIACTPAYAASGILVVLSDPPGAQVYLDGAFVGTTPYQSVDMQAGWHVVKAILGDDYPSQVKEVAIDPTVPKTIEFVFKKAGTGTFSGKIVEEKAEKFKGNVTLASIPLGATIFIDGKRQEKPAPLGYKDVEVGRYDVEFVLAGKSLKGSFDVVRGETVQIVADFEQRKLIDKWKEARDAEELRKQESEEWAAKARAERERAAAIARKQREEKDEKERLLKERERIRKEYSTVIEFGGRSKKPDKDILYNNNMNGMKGVSNVVLDRFDVSGQFKIYKTTMNDVVGWLPFLGDSCANKSYCFDGPCVWRGKVSFDYTDETGATEKITLEYAWTEPRTLDDCRAGRDIPDCEADLKVCADSRCVEMRKDSGKKGPKENLGRYSIAVDKDYIRIRRNDLGK